MGRISLRQVAVAAAAVLLGSRRALALPQAHETVQPPPSPWVTVNEAGVGVTMTPHVVDSNGVTTTQNPPPGSLTSIATYTISPNGRASTYTGLAPVATATATGGNSAGAFLACTQYQSATAPFCAPQNGAVLHQGFTYYITWNPGYFSNPDIYLEVQGTYDGGQGMTTGMRVTASTGFYAWTIPSDFLSQLKHNSLNMTFQFAKEADETEQQNDFEPILGPTVLIVSGPPPSPGGSEPSRNGPNAVAIAVPVVVVSVLLLLLGLCFWSWRRTGTFPIFGALGKSRRSSGYGVRQSQSERVGTRAVGASDKAGPNVGIQLTDRDSWSPTGTGNSRNVFREELRRQEQQR